MTQEELLEGHKLIADFMYPQRDKRRKDYPFPFTVIEVVPAEDIIGYGKVSEGEIKHFSGSPNMMEYNLSWNWLMPVVEKIEKLGYRVTIQGLNCWIDTHKGAIFGTDKKNSKRNSVYIAVVEFIKWYNQNKNKQ